MKTILIILSLLFSALQIQAHPHVCVKVMPVRPNVVVVRPACPSPAHVWVDAEWRWNPYARNYEWMEGRWERPQPYTKWVPGHWKQNYEGFFWVPGHWKQLR